MTRDLRGLFALVLSCSAPAVTFARSVDTTPRHAILCADGERFVAEDEGSGLALYRITDGTILRRFAIRGTVHGRVKNLVLSPDEKRLLVACADGSLVLWNTETGERVWQKEPDATGLAKAMEVWFPRSANFAANGERFAYPTDAGALVFDARTGDRIVTIEPPGKKVAAVALGSDGAGGFLVTPDGRLFRFEVAAGRVEDTGIVAEGWQRYSDAYPQPSGGWVRYSTDGKWIAFPSSGGVYKQQLSVVRLDDKLTRRDFGEFGRIGHLRAAADGSFLVTAYTHVPRSRDRYVTCVGARVWPDEGRAEELWRLTTDSYVDLETDFSPQTMFGLRPGCGAWRAMVIDLRKGEVALTLGEREESSWFGRVVSPDRGGWLVLWGLLALVVLFVVFLRRRMRRAT